jgi:NADH-quinone oxidoreductase subunit E
MLSTEERDAIEAERVRYPTPEAVAIEAMKIVQSRRGWLSDEALRDVAEHLGLSVGELDGVASFYNLLYRRPVGRHVILVCDSVSCWMLGYDALREALTRRLGVGLGQTTPDGRFTLLPSVCLGACDRAPVLMIGRDLHENVDPARLDDLLARYE